MKNKKILILSPNTDQLGGVSFYCKTLSDNLNIKHELYFRGAISATKENILKKTSRLIINYIIFFIKLLKNDISLIHQNTSLGKAGILRDSVYILIAKFYRRKIELKI